MSDSNIDTIYDVPRLSEDEASRRVRATLDAYPSLKRVYHNEKIADLVRRRASTTNHLLFRLVLDVDDDRSATFWSQVVADLDILESRGSYDAFHDQMQSERKEPLTSWRTELRFAAWLARNGIDLQLKPAVAGKEAEFVTITDPPTWWEVKTPLELEEQRVEEAAIRDVQRRLNEIPEPFVLHLVRAKLSLADVPRAVKTLRQQIRKIAEESVDLPVTLEADGLVIEVAARTKHRPTGFLGTTQFGASFGNEHAEQIVEKIGSAIPQLPADGAGVVVIDRTLSDWNDEHSVVDACFGVPGMAMVGGNIVDVRGQGYFRPTSGTRVSMVISYSRHPMHSEHGPELLLIHNPFANIPIPTHLFAFPNIRHLRCIE